MGPLGSRAPLQSLVLSNSSFLGLARGVQQEDLVFRNATDGIVSDFLDITGADGASLALSIDPERLQILSQVVAGIGVLGFGVHRIARRPIDWS